MLSTTGSTIKSIIFLLILSVIYYLALSIIFMVIANSIKIFFTGVSIPMSIFPSLYICLFLRIFSNSFSIFAKMCLRMPWISACNDLLLSNAFLLGFAYQILLFGYQDNVYTKHVATWIVFLLFIFMGRLLISLSFNKPLSELTGI